MVDIKTSLHGRRFGIGFDEELVLNNPSTGQQDQLSLWASHTVTSAELLALNATAQAVIAAPGAGLAIVPVFGLVYKPAGTAYSGIAAGEDLVLKYTDASGAICSSTIETTGFLDQTTAQTRSFFHLDGSPALVANAAGALHLLSGEITTGDSPLYLRINYRIVDMVFTT